LNYCEIACFLADENADDSDIVKTNGRFTAIGWIG
jgi:hypothetical protein